MTMRWYLPYRWSHRGLGRGWLRLWGVDFTVLLWIGRMSCGRFGGSMIWRPRWCWRRWGGLARWWIDRWAWRWRLHMRSILGTWGRRRGSTLAHLRRWISWGSRCRGRGKQSGWRSLWNVCGRCRWWLRMAIPNIRWRLIRKLRGWKLALHCSARILKIVVGMPT